MSSNSRLGSPSTGRRRIHPGFFAAMVVLVFAGTIAVGAGLGAWQVSGRGSGEGSGQGSGDGSGRVAPTQNMRVTDIKGWMAIGDVAASFSVPLPEVLDAFDLAADTPPSTALKDLESDLFSVTALRDWLTSRTAGASEGP